MLVFGASPNAPGVGRVMASRETVRRERLGLAALRDGGAARPVMFEEEPLADPLAFARPAAVVAFDR
jgi:hypothetical protein